MKILILVLSSFVLSVPAHADTRSSDKGKATQEQKASPAAPKQDEEQAEAHSQPDNPHPKASKSRSKAKAAKKPSASVGSSRPSLDADQELAFKKHDLDGDGEISKAEAAGSDLIDAFDRFDRNKNGKLSRAEYARAMSAAKRQASK